MLGDKRKAECEPTGASDSIRAGSAPMSTPLAEYVVRVLGKQGLGHLADSAVAVLSNASWSLDDLKDPSFEARLVAVLKDPWLYFDEKGKMPYGLDALSSDAAGRLNASAVVVAGHLMSALSLKRPAPLDELVNLVKAPSSFAKHSGKGSWYEILVAKGKKESLVCHRYSTERTAVPVSLLCPAFGSFVENYRSIEISSEDCIGAIKVVQAMCDHHDRENSRRDAFHTSLKSHFGIDFGVRSSGTSTTDGSIEYSHCSSRWLAVLEVKNEKGLGGGDPYMQAIGYYLKKFEETPAEGLQVPCILLDLCGYALGISGIVNTHSYFVCDPLIPTHLLLADMSLNHRISTARLFKSLKLLIDELHEIESFPRASEFPGFTTLRLDDQKVELEYKMRVGNHLLFKAHDISSGLAFAVKFVERPYPSEAHRCAHRIGFAPKLFDCFRCPPNHWAVVMEWADVTPLGKENYAAMVPQARDFLKQFHANQFVHGDFRPNNLAIGKEDRLVVLDFDWAGTCGEVTYPPFMNPEIAWPPGADSGRIIPPEHDFYWCDRIASGIMGSLRPVPLQF